MPVSSEQTQECYFFNQAYQFTLSSRHLSMSSLLVLNPSRDNPYVTRPKCQFKLDHYIFLLFYYRKVDWNFFFASFHYVPLNSYIISS